MRDSYSKFQEAGVTVVVVAKDSEKKVKEYWAEESIPYIGVPDPEGRIGSLYHQKSKFGLMPAVFVIDREGVLKMAHYGTSMKDIPTVNEIIERAQTTE
jgi:peroxiredoxin Q/BCP